jgi:hypothetical protein
VSGMTVSKPVHIGYRELWSKDKTTLVQVFTDLQGLILSITVTTRPDRDSDWGPSTEVAEID